MLDFQQQLDKFFQDNDRGYPRDPRKLAYKKLQKNTQGMDREQLEAFVDANLMIPHSQYKMALGNLIEFLRKYDGMNKLNEVKQFKKLAGLLKETWHPDDPSSVDIDDTEEDPDDFDDLSEVEGEGTDYDESSDSESDDTDAMGGINEAEPRKKGTLDQKEKIVEKLQYAIEDYLEDLGLKELSDEEKPKFQKGLGFTQTTPSDAFINKTRTGFHVTASDDDPRRSDPRHNDQQVTYGLRIYKPNEKFNISTLRSFIQQAKREAKAEGFRFSDTVRRSNQDILCSVTVR